MSAMNTSFQNVPATLHRVLVSGATGYLGRQLVPELVRRGHQVRALVRQGSSRKLDPAAEPVIGDALAPADIRGALSDCDTLVHLVGVPKPSPSKAREFRAIDLVSIRASVAAVESLPVESRPHLIYLSVAQPAPVMRAYVAVRAEGEAMIRERELNATCLRPWYVLGPGHRWPYLLMPLYALLQVIPATRAGAQRMGFVTLPQMIRALVDAVEKPARGVRIVEVPEIRAVSRGAKT